MADLDDVDRSASSGAGQTAPEEADAAAPVESDSRASDQAGSELDPRYVPMQRLLRRLRAMAFAAGTLVVVTVLVLAGDDAPAWRAPLLGATWIAAIALVLWHAQRWPAREFAHTRYRLDADGLQIASGVFWRRITHVPRSRVQHTDVSQGPLERRYGLSTLVVYTAGTDHSRVSLPGLASETAIALRDELRRDLTDDHV